MTDLPTLHALADRIERATGADREIDALLMPLAGHVLCSQPWERDHPMWSPKSGDIVFDIAEPTIHFTASLDAAVALVGHALPGWWWDVCTYEPGRYEAFVNPPDYRDPNTHPCGMGMDTSPARALVRATLRGLISVAECAARDTASPAPAEDRR